MGFFRVDGGGARQAVRSGRPKALPPAAPTRKGAAAPVATRKPAGKGVNLDLSAEADDGEFEKF